MNPLVCFGAKVEDATTRKLSEITYQAPEDAWLQGDELPHMQDTIGGQIVIDVSDNAMEELDEIVRLSLPCDVETLFDAWQTVPIMVTVAIDEIRELIDVH